MLQKLLSFLLISFFSCYLYAQNCNPPSNLALVTRDATSATFSWSAQSGVVGYEVSWRDVNSNSWQTGYTTSPIYAITGLSAGTVYEFRVRTECQRSGVFSNYTNPVLFATQNDGNNRCDMPSGFNFSQVTGSSATLSWQPVNGATGYEVSYRIVNGTWTNVTTSSTSYTLSGLNPNTSYEAQVRALCRDNQVSTFTKPLQFSTQAAGSNADCGTPAGLRAYNATESSITLNWTPSSGDVWFYEIQYRRADSDFWFLAFTTSTTRMLTFLQPNTRYEVRVRAICGISSASSYTSTVSFSTTERTSTCNIPQNIRVRQVDADGLLIGLQWDDISSNYWLYEVQYRPSGGSFWIPFFSTDNRATILLWSRNEDYEVRVRALCGFNYYSDWSNIITVSSNSNNPNCAAPTSPASANITANSATLSWNPTPGAVEYTLRYRFAGNWLWRRTLSTTSSSVSLNNLQPLYTYEWQVRAECSGNGASAWSPINSFTTLNGRMGELESAEKPIEVSVFPNPNNGIFVASYRASQAGEATVTVTDLNGKVFFSQSLEVEPGVNETPINLRSAPQGLYILKVAQNGQTAFQKLVIE
jgi:hypothetical protein